MNKEKPTNRQVGDAYTRYLPIMANILKKIIPEEVNKSDFLLSDCNRKRIFDSIMSSEVTPATKRGKIDAMRFLARQQGARILEEEDKKYKENSMAIKKEVADHENKNSVTYSDSNWIKWEQILEMYKFHADWFQKVINNEIVANYRGLQDLLMLSMYVNHPPLRLNYSCVHLFPEQKLDTDNYIYKDSGDNYLCHIGWDKAAKFKGSFEFKIHDDTKSQIDFTNLKFPRSYLITKSRNQFQPLEEHDFSHYVSKLNTGRFLKNIRFPDGSLSNLTACNIRSAYATYCLAKHLSNEEIDKLAESMRTSRDDLLNYYRKVYDQKGDKIY